MRRLFLALSALLLLAAFVPVSAEEGASSDRVRKFTQDNIQWMGNASLKITGEKITLYFDPLSNVKPAQAGIILITHSHSDHLYPDAIKNLTGPDTAIVAPESYVANATILKPGDKTKIKGVEIEAVPAYNITGTWHPRAKGWVGYIIVIDGIRIYISGDTDRIPEMKGIKPDIAILSIPGSGFAMDYDEAALAAQDIMPKIAIPVHYMGVVTDPEAGKFFQDDLKGKIEVIVKPQKMF